MKQFTHFVFGALIICSLIGGAFGQGLVESDLQKIANKSIPEGMVSAHEAVQGRFAGSATKDSSGNIVVLYKKGSLAGRYQGLILIPQESGAYSRYQLPEPASTWSMMDPSAVFFANADGDTENELFIIDKCYTGIGPTGASAFYRTRVYDWNGIAFSHVDSVSEKIGNANTVAMAKAKLRQFSKTLKSQKTQMLVAVEFGAHNEQIDKAAVAGEAWVKEPAQIIARTFGGFSEMRSKTVEFAAPTADEAESLSITITNDGYLDDSVRGEKYSLELKMNEQGVWKFVAAAKAWRCQPGRGNQDYSTIKCT
ncbi:MAG: hypothetical protein ND866_16185 [Pyrinomonadaceae bacterium]|nr:hypothetical protein [Pyrinomonadaceae bacterium]